MTGRNGHRGHGNAGRGGGCDAGRGAGDHGCGNTARSNKLMKVGLCKDLEGNIFDFRRKTAAHQMRTTQEKIVHYIEMNYGMDITNDLKNRKKFIQS